MNSHNTKTELAASKESVPIRSQRDDVRLVNFNPAEAAELSISDDCDTGGDPYNSTGTHVIIPSNDDLDA